MRRISPRGSHALAALSLLAVTGLAAACSSNSDDATVGSGATETPGPETIATAANATLGTILVDEDGKTLYYFLKDKTSKSTCADQCANVWPPVITTGAPVAGTGATATLLGVTARSDGSSQVTYDGHPLYYYVADKAAGDTKGQDLSSFGAKWYAVAPDGKKVDKDGDADTDATEQPSASPSSTDDSSTHY